VRRKKKGVRRKRRKSGGLTPADNFLAPDSCIATGYKLGVFAAE
jgi:hypothetical protein